jgi:hypothetical protein
MENISFVIEGTEPLLMCNPQTVDPFNHYKIASARITKKRAKTEEDLLELRRIDVESKLYFDPDIGVYVPATWLTSALAGAAWKQKKISKAEMRSAIFPEESRIKLHFSGMKKVKGPSDISGNPEFNKLLLLKQGQVKVPKAAPIFHDWKFSTSLTFDKAVVDKETLVDLLTYIAFYGGFGDFRPTYGRGKFLLAK